MIPSKISLQKIELGDTKYQQQSFLGFGKSKLHDSTSKQKKKIPESQST